VREYWGRKKKARKREETIFDFDKASGDVAVSVGRRSLSVGREDRLSALKKGRSKLGAFDCEKQETRKDKTS
jgi:hypothetical protein